MAQARPLQGDDPAVLGGYELHGRLGASPRGVVYAGRRDGMAYAVKLLNLRAAVPPLLPAIPSMCAAHVVETGLAGERPYIVSELVEGPSMSAVVEADGPRGGEKLDRSALGMLAGLGALHQAGVVHGNLHPGNVVCGPQGPVIVDYGVARGGVPAFSAPEQVAADEFTFAGDMFAWASTIVYAATGRPPFGDGDTAGVFHRILRDEPDLGRLSGSLRQVVAACLSKDPAARPLPIPPSRC
ncbi:serine/threonine protein kinase [Nonomuraea antimicrobica]